MRKDLSRSQQAVQAGHAVAEYLLRGPSTSWGNGTLVYLGVRNEDALKYYAGLIGGKGHYVVGFKEPDRRNELTAIAVECPPNIVKHLRLL